MIMAQRGWLDGVAPQLGYLCGQTSLGKQAGYFGAEPSGGNVLLINSAAQDIADLLLHAAAVTLGAPLQLGLYRILKIADDELSHDRPPFSL
jgi:hypothetical protein